MNECKLCGREVPDYLFMPEYELCYDCNSELAALVGIMPEKIAEYQAAANAATEPEEKITNLTHMLDLLYTYKVKYRDNDVDVIEQDVDDLISSVINVISHARL